MDATKGMLNEKAFAQMKDGVIILNAARDALVNDNDLEVALKSGKVRKYVTDFPNAKTANMDGVVAISHLGASTEEAEDNCAVMAVNEIVQFIENGNLINSVTYPALDLGAKNGTRVVVLYNAEEQNAEKLLEELKPCGLNKFVSGVKGKFGALLAEVNKAPEKDLNAIKTIIIK